jgi:hypothetical protein
VIEYLLLGIALLGAAFILVWVVYMLAAEYSAVAYVPSAAGPLITILKKTGLNKNKIFWDMGSGDGRIVIETARKFGCFAVGIELNPLLIIWSKVRAKFLKINNADFIWGNFWSRNLKPADFVYCYLSPKAMKNIGNKFISEGKEGAILISKAFAANKLQNFLIKKEAISERKYYVYRKIIS